MNMPPSTGQIRTLKEFSKYMDKRIELNSSELKNNYSTFETLKSSVAFKRIITLISIELS